MSVFKCKMCGGTLEINLGETVGTCEYCGTKQTLPKLDDDRKANMFDRANHFRRNNDYDKAASIYEQILNEDNTDAETYWSLVLCRYGIEYVEDPATHKRIPTVNRAQFTSIFDDENYKAAIQYADIYQRSLYEEEANTINEIQKGILAISQKEEPFDVFICYKETDNNGRRTMDSVLANDLYHQLIQEGFKVFFSRITLEDKLGTAYEPYIFAALNSAKVMVVLGTRPEHFNAAWVKNEWSRYLALVKQSNGKKVLIPAYRDMDPYDLPEEFSHLQAQDMSKLGFMQDLIRGIKKIAKEEEPKVTTKEAVVVNSVNSNVVPLLRRAFIFLEDGEWERADDFCEQALNLDPENAQAYLGKLMASLKVKTQEDLKNCKQSFENDGNYKKVLRFGDNALSETVGGYISFINERNENARLTGIYNEAVSAMKIANDESGYKYAAERFKSIKDFKDAEMLAEKCIEIANELGEAEKNARLEAEKQAEILVEAIKRAMNAKSNKLKQEPLKKHLSIEQMHLSALQPLTQKIDSYELELQKYKKIEETINQLQTKKSSLGLFEGRERKQINEEIRNLTEEKNNSLNIINSLKNALKGFLTKQEVEEEIRQTESRISDITDQIEEISIQSDNELSYSQAVKIYYTNENVRSLIHSKYRSLENEFKNMGFYKSSEIKNANYNSNRYNVIIKSEKCLGCGLCFKSCPKDAFFFESNSNNKLGRVAAINYNICDLCNQCVSACKFGAIICK